MDEATQIEILVPTPAGAGDDTSEMWSLDRSLERLRELDTMFAGRVSTCLASSLTIEHELSNRRSGSENRHPPLFRVRLTFTTRDLDRGS